MALSKLRLEERLGRPVRAFAYVKGSEAHYRPVHLSLLKQAGYEIAFTSVSGANGPGTDPLQLHRYNVEPYPARTFELVLSGACDLIAVKDTVAGTHARRLFNAALGTCTSMTIQVVARREKIPVKSVEITVTNDRMYAKDCADCTSTEGYIHRFTVSIKVTGDLTPAQRDRILTVAKRCPVAKTLTSEIRVDDVLVA